jgi:hypothetical protein
VWEVNQKLLYKTKIRSNEKENSRIIRKNLQNEARRFLRREGAKAL